MKRFAARVVAKPSITRPFGRARHGRMTAVLVLGAAVASGAALLDRAPDRAGAANMHNAGWPAHEITAPDDAAARP